MKIDLTEHARARMQQRAISKRQIELIERFGESIDQKGGTEYAFIPSRVIAELRNALDKIEGVRVVSTPAGRIVTVMHTTRRLRSA